MPEASVLPLNSPQALSITGNSYVSVSHVYKQAGLELVVSPPMASCVLGCTFLYSLSLEGSLGLGERGTDGNPVSGWFWRSLHEFIR